MASSTIVLPTNLRILGTLEAEGFDPPDDSIGDEHIRTVLAYTVLQQNFRKTHGQKATASPSTFITAFDECGVIHEVFGATGLLLAIRAGSVGVAVGDSTVTIDVKKNGTTVLSSVITLDSGNTTYISEAGTLAVTSLAVGDILTFHIDATVGTGTLPTGVWVSIHGKEDPT